MTATIERAPAAAPTTNHNFTHFATIPQPQLVNLLGAVSRSVPGKTAIPILAHVALSSSDDGELEAMTSNLELGTRAWACATTERGAITVPHNLLSGFVANLPTTADVELSIDARTNTLHVRCGRTECNIRGMSAEDFPSVPVDTDQIIATLTISDLLRAISQTAPFASTDDNRPVLTGVLFEIKEGGLTMAAADGFRLGSVTLTPGNPDACEDCSMIIPSSTLKALASMLKGAEEGADVTLRWGAGGTTVFFETDSLSVTSRLVEGNFPNFRQIIPTAHTTRMVMDKATLERALKLTRAFARDSKDIVRLDIQLAGELSPGCLALESNAAEVGDGKSLVDATIEGEALQIALNGSYFAGALAAITTDKVLMEFCTASHPAVLKPLGKDDYTHVIMPMHLANR